MNVTVIIIIIGIALADDVLDFLDYYIITTYKGD